MVTKSYKRVSKFRSGSGSKVRIDTTYPPNIQSDDFTTSSQTVRDPEEIDKIFTIAKTVVGGNMTSETTSENCETWYNETQDFLREHNIKVSTITLDCKLHMAIDVNAFAKYVTLREDEVVSVKYGNRKDCATNRTIIAVSNKKNPSKRNFYNQVTILMRPMNNSQRNYINIKVFKNGSLQMTGCKDMDDFSNVTAVLVKVLRRGADIKGTNGKKKHIKFVEKPDELAVYDVKIRMINSNFKLNYKVDRKKLDKLLKTNHGRRTKDRDIGYVECKYEPTGGHSCVNIKFRYNDKDKPSIFVFQTGSIIITGAKNLHQIIQAYHFIHKILDRYYNEIKIVEIPLRKLKSEIRKYFESQARIQC